jgi:hypothetical protein
MRPLPFVLVLLFVSAGLLAQTPQARLTYEDRSGNTGHTLVVDGKSFGPYKEITSVTHSTSATAAVFLVNRRDKTYIVAQGKEVGPLPAGFEADQSWISDDGRVSAVTAVKYDDSGEDSTSQTQLWVNGKNYGPFQALSTFDYAETGGSWIASVQTGEEEYSVLLNGKAQGTFASVDHVWLFPDGKGWGYAATDSDGKTTVVTQDRTYDSVQNYNFDQMFPRSQHWGMGFRLGDEEELILVDGKLYPGYLNFSGLSLTSTGRHWGFEAQKLTDAGDYPVVVIDGKEFQGEGLSTTSLGATESFTWTVRDGAKVTIQVLTLP